MKATADALLEEIAVRIEVAKTQVMLEFTGDPA